MIIITEPKDITDNYTKIPNGLLQDDRLTMKQLAVLVYLYSRGENWQPRRTEIMRHFKIKDTHTYSGIIKGLKKLGYLTNEKQKQRYCTKGKIDYIWALEPLAFKYSKAIADAEKTEPP